MKVTCDRPLTRMASSLYRLLGTQIGHGYADATARPSLRDFIDAVGPVTRTEQEVIGRDHQRAHHPWLLAAGVATTQVAVPWLAGKRLRLVFGSWDMVLSQKVNMGIRARYCLIRADGLYGPDDLFPD
jgi:hypothetical protein